MKLRQFVVNAFTREPFGGNPAAIVPLDAWIDDALMQAIATQNQLSETAFFVAEGEGYRIRWFTPAAEIDLAGHPTLAAGHVLLGRLAPHLEAVTFASRGGPLGVSRANGRLELDFPERPRAAVEPPAGLADILGAPVLETYLARDLMVVLGSEREVLALRPSIDGILRLGVHGVIVTAPGETSDFVSRFFAPGIGVPEDPVTGSAHCALAPYWAGRLGRADLFARQLSARRGELWCAVRGDRVRLGGHCVDFLEGHITVA